MLLRGTELFQQKETFQMQEHVFAINEDGDLGGIESHHDRIDFGIPYVISSNTFNQYEWTEMKQIASTL